MNAGFPDFEIYVYGPDGKIKAVLIKDSIYKNDPLEGLQTHEDISDETFDQLLNAIH